jgi:hypothetical protein
MAPAVTAVRPKQGSAGAPSDHFTDESATPFVDAVSPAIGRSRGGQHIKIKGTGFMGATEVHFGSARAPRFEVNHKGNLIFAVDPAIVDKATVDVTVTTPQGTSPITPADEFSYRVHSPMVTDVSPHQGEPVGGTIVNIAGANFFEVTAVKFGLLGASEFTVKSSSSITATSPAETVGIVKVTVSTPFGTSGSELCTLPGEGGAPELKPCARHDRFKFVDPTITSVTPSSGPAAGGTTVTVTGTGFGPGATATIFDFDETRAASVDCASITTCTVVAPAHVAGKVSVRAIVPATGVERDFTKRTPADRFAYE